LPTPLGTTAPAQTNEVPESPVKFKPEEWQETFKKPTLFVPNLATLGSQSGRPASSTGRKQNRPRAMSKSEERLGANARGTEGQPVGQDPAQSTASSKDDADAMDIDMETSPQPRDTRSSESRKVRNVTMPLHNPDWRQSTVDPKSTSTNPSTIPIAQMPFTNQPSAVPNAVPPPPPPPGPPPLQSKISPRGAGKGPPLPLSDRGPASLNLADLGQNLTAHGSGGVTNLSDLSSTLPFSSQASEKHPNAPALGALNIPKPPNTPNAPAVRRLSTLQWKQYVSAMSVYMGQWYIWDGRILEHLKTRHEEAAKFGTGLPSIQGTTLLEARGDVKEGGIERWEAELEQDRRVRDFWGAACNKHQKCIREFVAVKKRVAAEGLMA
jgi:hypothetical protein